MHELKIIVRRLNDGTLDMIIKVIPNTLGTSVENRINGLSDYIHNPNQTRIDYLPVTILLSCMLALVMAHF